MAHRFIIDDSTGALYSDFTCRRLTSAADILKSERGLSPTLEIYLVNVATDTRAVTGQTLTNADLDIILGSAGKMPDEGIIKIGWNDSGTLYESGYVDVKNLSDDAIAAAFNSTVSPVTDAEGINVDNIGEGKWLLTMKKVGAISGNPTFDVEGCNPPSAVEVSSVRTGDLNTKGQWIISIAQSPVASISGGSFSAVTSGSFSGLSASISLNTTAMIASISRGIKDFELSITHNNQLLHRSPVSIYESLDPTTAGTLIISSPSLFTLGSNAVNQGETIALSGGLSYDGTTLAAPFLPLAGGTMTGDVLFGDNVKAKFGTDTDLEIYHTGSSSVIHDRGTGGLKIDTNYLQIRDANQSETLAKFTQNGAVELFYNNQKKLETTDTGSTISGKLIINGDLDVSGTTTTFNSSVVTVDDPVFTVGGDTAPVASDNKDRGIEFRYFRSGESAKVGFFGYSNADDAFKLLTSATNNSEVFSGTLADLKASKTLLEDGSASAPSYSFASDSNTGIYRASGDLAFSTGGTEAARFDSDGNFTTVENIKIPDGKYLFLGGSSDLQIYHNGFNSNIDNYTSDLYIQNRVNGGRDIIFKAKNSSDVLTELLRLDGSASSINVPDDVMLKVGSGGLSMEHKSNNETWNYYSSASGHAIYAHGGQDQDFIFKTTPSSTGSETELLRLDGSASSVLVGTSSVGNSAFNLEVKSGLAIQDSVGGSQDYHCKLDTSSDTGRLRLTNGVNFGLIMRGVTNQPEIGAYATNGVIKFMGYTNSGGTAGSEVARMDVSTGRLGLGVTSPSAKLDISSDDEIVAIFSSTDNKSIIQISDDDTNGYLCAENSRVSLGFYQGAHVNNLNLYNNNLGIGTASPSQKMTIVGTSDTGIIQHIQGATNYGATTRYSRAGLYTWQIGIGGSSATANDIPVSAFGIVEGSDTRLTVATGGNVGIGTTSPSKTLHVNSGPTNEIAIFESTDGTGYISIQDSNTTNSLQGIGSVGDQLTLYSNNAERIRIKSDGKVGIGTTTPNELLEVDGNIRLGDGGARDIIGPTNENLRILANPNSSTEGIIFSTDGGTTTEMFIQDGGNVGIGTTSPSNLLTVDAGSGNAVGLTVKNDTYSGSFIPTTLGGMAISTANPFLFYINSAERMRIDTSGNVGIGTTAPSALLDVAAASGSAVQIKNTGTAASLLLSIDSSTNSIYSRGINASTGRDFRIIQGSSEAMRIDSSGNVGIGTTAPDFALDVGGDIGIDDKIYHNGDHNTYIGFTGSDTISLRTGGTDVITLDSSQRCGIGTTSFSNLLSVVGKSDDQTSVVKITRSHSSASNDTYTLDVDSSSHTSNMTAGGAFSVKVNSGKAFKINGNGDIFQNYINYTDESNYEALKISAESDHIKYDTTSIGSFASNVRDHRFYVNGTQRFYVTNSGAWTTGNFYINGSGALRQASDHLYLSTSTQTNNDIIFKPANTEAVRIGSNGVIDFSFANSTVKLFESANNDVRFGTNTSDAFSLIQNGSRRLLIAATGKVGIASNDPSANADLTLGGGELCMAETTTPTADANFGKIYCKSDNKLYFQDGAGTEHEIAFV